jgi:hypothetical protein
MASISNAEIIHNEAMLAGLDPEAEYLTFAQWKFRGYSVIKGQHAVIKTGLWTPCKASKAEMAENPEAKVRCYLKTSHLFTREQVEPMKQSQQAS